MGTHNGAFMIVVEVSADLFIPLIELSISMFLLCSDCLASFCSAGGG
jgi:hypothetical protein